MPQKAWGTPERRTFLRAYLAAARETGHASIERLRYLGAFMRARRTLDVAELGERLRECIVSIEVAIRDAGGPRPFFSPQIQEWHGGGRDRRSEATDARQADHEREHRIARELEQDFRRMAKV